MARKEVITTPEWIAIFVAMGLALAGAVAYAHNTFETKEIAFRRSDRNEARFIRIEQLQIETLKALGRAVPPPDPQRPLFDSQE